MRLPFRSRNKVEGLSTPNETIFDEAIELAQLRLQQCIADLHDRIRTPQQALNLHATSVPEEDPKSAAA